MLNVNSNNVTYKTSHPSKVSESDNFSKIRIGTDYLDNHLKFYEY